MSYRVIRHAQVRMGETLRVELPGGIGTVEIRTGERDARTGNPRVAVRVDSDSMEDAAEDGRFYDTKIDSAMDTIYLIGHQREEG